MNHHNNRMLLGTVIIVVGVLALIDNLHLFGNFDVITFWPTAFIVAGILKIGQTRTRGGQAFGAIMIAVGALLTLGHLGLIYFSVHQIWPLILIGIGVLVMSKGWVEKELGFGAGPNGFRRSDAPYSTADASSTLNVLAVMSGSKMRKDTQDFRGGEITAVMGGVEIDLRQASIQGDAVINLFVTWGGVVLKVPSDWVVIGNAIPVLGGIEDRTVPPAAPGKRLILEGYVVMGGVEVKN
ncbi:MAG TPA: DUF5668 domain-containing protein [Burkholderiaceae bacterium]